MVTGHTNDSRRNNASRSADTGRKAYLVPRGGGPQAHHWDHGSDSSAMHLRTADDLFGTPQGSLRTDKLIAASIQWAERIMRKIDDGFGKAEQ
jgi:hypothetical protein